MLKCYAGLLLWNRCVTMCVAMARAAECCVAAALLGLESLVKRLCFGFLQVISRTCLHTCTRPSRAHTVDSPTRKKNDVTAGVLMVLHLIEFIRFAFHLSERAQREADWITCSPVEYKEWKESVFGVSSVARSLAAYSQTESPHDTFFFCANIFAGHLQLVWTYIFIYMMGVFSLMQRGPSLHKVTVKEK